MAQQPLAGIRVLAVEQMEALPRATQVLARLGAEVVKVEHPDGGEPGRSAQPSLTGPDGAAMGATFLRTNLSKRSITLNLKTERGRQLFLDLVPAFDVVCENFKSGGMGKLGLSYSEVAAVHPGVIYLSVSGFGNTGDSPYQHWPAYGPVAEAMSGIYNFNRPDGTEVRVSPMAAVGDTTAALYGVIGVLAALRHRDATGEGQQVDISIYDAMVALADIVPNYQSLGKDPSTPSAIIIHGFPIANGELAIMIPREYQFERLAHLVGQPGWLDDPRFAVREGWVEHIDVLRAAVTEWAGDMSVTEAADAMARAGVAVGPVHTADDVIADPHVAARNMLVEMTFPSGESALAAGNPVKLSAIDEVPDELPPVLGAHTDDILSSTLGLSPTDLATLRSDGVI